MSNLPGIKKNVFSPNEPQPQQPMPKSPKQEKAIHANLPKKPNLFDALKKK